MRSIQRRNQEHNPRCVYKVKTRIIVKERKWTSENITTLGCILERKNDVEATSKMKRTESKHTKDTSMQKTEKRRERKQYKYPASRCLITSIWPMQKKFQH